MDFTNPNAIRQAFEHQEQRIAALEVQLAALSATKARPRPILPDPEKFTGAHYDTWLPLMKAKLDIDGEAIGSSDKAYFWYIYGNLHSKIQALVLPLASEAQPKPSLIFDLLARIYEDPNKTSRASNRLCNGLRSVLQLSGDDSASTLNLRRERKDRRFLGLSGPVSGSARYK